MAQETIGHWHTLVDGLVYDPTDFYNELREYIKTKNIKDMTTVLQTKKVGGLFSASKVYLEISYKDFHFLVGASMFGQSCMFFSWWLSETLSKKRESAGIIGQIFSPETYYKIDERAAFQTLVQQSVLHVLEDVRQKQGLRPMTAEERQELSVQRG